MKKYNLHSIMAAAWKLFRKGVESFAQALRMAWANAKARNAAKTAAGISEEAHTWSGWATKSPTAPRPCSRPPPTIPPPRAASGSLPISASPRFSPS